MQTISNESTNKSTCIVDRVSPEVVWYTWYDVKERAIRYQLNDEYSMTLRYFEHDGVETTFSSDSLGSWSIIQEDIRLFDGSRFSGVVYARSHRGLDARPNPFNAGFVCEE